MTIAPSNWPAAERRHWETLQYRLRPGNPVALGFAGAVTTAHNALATRIGIEALKQGGSAVDATLAAAFSQIVLGGGAVISFFGIFGLVHHEARTGEITTLQGGWKSCREETDPMTIPAGGNAATNDVREFLAGTPSARAAMVGGFFRAAEAAHRRFGKLPWATLLAPAIELAESGFEVSEELGIYLGFRLTELQRLPETRSIFFKPDGTPYVPGDRFRQPALATTLRAVAREGTDYLYRGPWAERCVAAVRAEGGKMTLADLAEYEPIWAPPRRAERNGWELALLGDPCFGSVSLIEALNLTDVAGIRARGHWTRSARSFRDLVTACSAYALSYYPPQYLPPPLAGLDLSLDGRVSRDHAETLWAALNAPDSMIRTEPAGTKSDDVVVVDQWGNWAALCHSSNCMCWGPTALVVDGITIHDPAGYQQILIAMAGPGNHLPMPIEVGLMLRNGKPEIGFATKNMGLHQKAVPAVLNVTDFGMNVAEADAAGALCLPVTDPKNPLLPRTRVVRGDFDPALLAESGLAIHELSAEDAWLGEGHWIAVQRDPATGRLMAISPRYASGQAAAY